MDTHEVQVKYAMLKNNIKDESLSRRPKRRVSVLPSEADLEETGETDHESGEDTDSDSDESYVSLPAELPPPPDGGWGWMIVFVAFFCNLIVDGVGYSFGSVLNEFADYFDEPKGYVSWISSLQVGIYLSIGPIASTLANRYGCRKVCFAGGLISGFAYAVTIFANSVLFLFITQGVLCGIGFGLIFLPSNISVGYYFERKRAVAIGIAVSGSGVGTFIFPPFIEHLLRLYGWKGTNLIISALIFNTCWLGALLRPIEVPRMSRKMFRKRLRKARRESMSVALPISRIDSKLRRYSLVSKDLSGGSSSSRDETGSCNSGPFGMEDVIEKLEKIEDKGNIREETENNTVEIKVSTEANVSEEEDLQKSLIKMNGHNSPVIKNKFLSPLQSKSRKFTLHNSMEGPQRPQSEKGIGRRFSMQKNVSVPNFERRQSRIETLNSIKLVPATSKRRQSVALVDRPKRLSIAFARGTSELNEMEEGSRRAAMNYANVRRRRSSIVIPPMSRQDIFYTGSIRNLPQFKRSHQSITSYRESTFNLQSTAVPQEILEAFDSKDDETDDNKVKNACVKSNFCQRLIDVFFLKDPIFLFISLGNIVGMLGFYTPYVYLPATAVEKGIARAPAAFLVSAIGISNIFGRIICGLIADRNWLSALTITGISTLLVSICVFIIPFAATYEFFLAIALSFGFFGAPIISLTSVVIVDLMGLSSLTNAFGVINMFRGMAATVGPPLAGRLLDVSKSWNLTFWYSGFLIFVCAFVYALVPHVRKFWAKWNYKHEIGSKLNNEVFDGIPEENEGHFGEGEEYDGGIIINMRSRNSNTTLS